MKRLNYLFAIIMLVHLSLGSSAQSRDWNGKKCAVVLTYDDAIDGHLDKVIPDLDRYNLKGTFYLIAGSPVVSNRLDEWRKAAMNGHELGNHTLYHPCDGSLPDREFVTSESDLSRYTVERAVREIRTANTLLRAIDGKTERTFAYPCGDRVIGDTKYYDQIANEFVAARGGEPNYPTLKEVNLNDVNAFSAHEITAQKMISYIQEAERKNSMVVLLFHGVGGGHGLNTNIEEHRKLLKYLQQRKKDIWVVPMVEVAKYIKANR